MMVSARLSGSRGPASRTVQVPHHTAPTSTEPDSEAGSDYISVMRSNLSTLTTALGCTS